MKIKKYLSLSLIFIVNFSLFDQHKIVAQTDSNLTINQICYDDLDREINQIINLPPYQRASWGIVVKKLNSDDLIYSLNGEKYFYPASNVKLLTTAAVLLKFGENYRFQTPIFISKNRDNLTILRIVGQGDPSLNSQSLQLIADKLKAENINHIDQLIVEENYHQNLGINSTWEWGDLFYYYAVNVNHLILNENVVNLTISPQNLGEKISLNWSDPLAQNQWNIINSATTSQENSNYYINLKGIFGTNTLEITGQIPINSPEDSYRLAILNPSQYFLDSLNNLLKQNQIKVNQTILNNSISSNLANEKLLMTIQSEPLSQLVFKTNQESNNLYAQALFQLLGIQSYFEDNQIINDDSLGILIETLNQLGIAPKSYDLIDGSGLSRHDLVTPQTLVNLLELISKSPLDQVYKNSLPIAGVTGTLKNRFTNSYLTNNLRAKTGTASGTSALSGYLKTQTGEDLVFSIIVNNSNQNIAILREGIDQIALLFSQTKNCHLTQHNSP